MSSAGGPKEGLTEGGCAAGDRRRMLRTALVVAAAIVVSVLLTVPAHGATLVVDDVRDMTDLTPGDGMCRTGATRCTLRAAIQEANALPGHDTITLPAGVYELQIPTLNEDLPTTGDHDVADTVTIAGAGRDATIVDGGWPLPGAPPEQRGLDRLLEIHPSAGNVTLSGLTLREGYAEEDGGAIQHWSPGLLRLDRVSVHGNYAAKAGGGVNNADPVDYEWPFGSLPDTAIVPSGRVEIVDSILSGNAASEGGAAINNASTGTVALLDGTSVVDNPGEMVLDPSVSVDPLDPKPAALIPGAGVYEPSGGAIVNQAAHEGVGTIRIADATIARNFSPSAGAGILNAGDGTVVVERSTIVDNITEADGAGIHTEGGSLTVRATTIADNEAHGNGGGLSSGGGTNALGLRPRVEIADTRFTDNRAWAAGGGLINDGETAMSMTDVAFSGNDAHDSGGGLNSGGSTSLELVRGTFTGNASENEGGGAYVESERPSRIADSTFTLNTAGVPGLEGNDAGGGGLHTGGGPVDLSDLTIADNRATAEGGGLGIHNHGAVTVTDTLVRGNFTPMSGGGVENSGMRVTFERVTVTRNRATYDGGGIHNSSSGEFEVLDTTVVDNRAMNGGGFTNASDSTLVVRRSLFARNVAKFVPLPEPVDEGGLGGGFYSISDGGGLMENTTISGNTASTRGGGMFHDADADFRIVNTTIWRNAAPFGGGISTVESDFVPSIPPQPNPLTLRNTIVAGSMQGGSCDAMLTSDGGNIDSGIGCQFAGARDRANSNPRLDALADNGGHVLTHAPRQDSFAVDWGARPCVEQDARGVARPQGRGCDAGAVEYDGPPPPFDDREPETEYVSGPTQDTLETVAFDFTGSDNLTTTEDLAYECRLVEHELTEPPEVLAPWDPVDIELLFVSCTPGWQRELPEDGLYSFEVRAIDRAGNVDRTPAIHTFEGMDTSPPNTIVAEGPPNPSRGRAATFTFSGTDNLTPPQFFEYECRLDSRDPDMWLECFNPTFYSNLTSGEHVLEVRAYDGNENVDPTPARYRWTVGIGGGDSGDPVSCDQANITLTAAADAWVDEVNAAETHLFDTELTVRSGASGNPEAREPLVGENARTLVRFALPSDADGCVLESATMRLFGDGGEAGRTIEAVPLAASWRESSVTWMNQPGTRPSAPATTPSSEAEGYREWDVLEHVRAMHEAGESFGWQIRDAHESDAELGGEQEFASRETPQDPPEETLPQLVLRYVADDTPPPPPPTPATTPTRVHCGQVLSESTLVANDLENCPGEGLVVGRSNIVVDLGGHVIDGLDYLIEGPFSGNEEGMPAGIRISNKTNVVVRNGTVQQFGWGVLMTSGTTHSVVEELTILRNAVAGVELFDADDGRNGNTIRHNAIDENELGVHLIAGTENALVADNHMQGNLGEALLILNSRSNRIERNEVNGIPLDPQLDSDGGFLLDGASSNVLIDNVLHDTGDAGILITRGSHGNRVEGGAYYRNGDAGVLVDESDRTEIVGITSHQQSDGGVVLVDAHDTVVRDSDLRFNPSGVEAGGTDRLVVERNDASHSLSTGFELADGLSMRIVDNVANQAGGAGIGLESGAFDRFGAPLGGALVQGNTTNENGSDGIAVSDGGHTVRANAASNNAGWGIDAGDLPVDGGTNVDGAGNRASGNQELEQCRGVACDASASVPLIGPDLTAPETAIEARPDNPSPSSTAVFRFGATDAVSPATAMTFECRLDPGPDPVPEPEEPEIEPPGPGELPEPPDTPPDGEGWTECVSPQRYTNLDEGPHHFQVRATDQADNKDLTPATYDWAIEPVPEGEDPTPDTTAPETRLTAGPSGELTSNAATFRFSGSDDKTPGASLRYECRLDDGAWAACTSPREYERLGLGAHTFAVRAIDRSGHLDPTPAERTWTIVRPRADTTPPNTTIASGPDFTTVRTSATFAFTASELEATFECSLDRAEWAACRSPLALSGLSAADHELRVRAVDAAGNADATPAAYAWTVTPPPVPTFVFCGQVLRHSVLVRNDLVDCLFDGLVVGAPGITIDLDGHVIDGKGVGSAIRNDGFDNVTIRNGRTIDFDYGVSLNLGTTRNVVEQLTLELNQEAGIGLGFHGQPDPNLPVEPPDPFPPSESGVEDNVLRDNDVLANKAGVWITGGSLRNVVRDNAIAATQGDGVFLERSHENRVEHNSVDNSSGAGVALEGSERNLVADNRLVSNDGGGVIVDITHNAPAGVPSDDNRVERNVVEEGGGLEVVESSGNQLIDNIVRRSSEAGVSLEYAHETLVRGNDVRTNKGGIRLKASSDNRLEYNDASDSEDTGIALESLSLANVLLGNTSSDNDGDGIYVGDETSGSEGMRIERNVTNNNKGHGIRVSKVAHTLTGNSANDNDSWGIWVSEGSNGRVNVDGGGNHAVGNLGPLDPMTLRPQQCYVIVCDGGSPGASDMVPPETQIVEGPADPTTDALARLRFAGSDNASDVLFQCRLEAQAALGWEACESPLEYADLRPGDHLFEVRAVDGSGNVDPTPAEHRWRLDPRPPGAGPVVTFQRGPDATTVETSATFRFSADVHGSSYECSLDGAAFAPCETIVVDGLPGLPDAPEVSFDGLAVGDHELRVRATDGDGVTGDAAAYAWSIAPPPTPAAIACGEIVMQSTLVTNDLLDCPGAGIIVGAPGITIDLDGHVIDGVGLEPGILNPGHDAVTITDGHVREFDYGVMLNPGTAGNVVADVRVEVNQEAGIALADADQGGSGNVIRENEIVSNGYGVALFSGTGFARVHDNHFGANEDDSVRMEHASGNVVERNEIATGGGAGVSMEGGGANAVLANTFDTNHGEGVIVGEELIPSNGNRVEGNEISKGGGAGIVVNDSVGTQVLNNEISQSNGAGVELELARETLVRGNDVGGNGGGIELSEASDNRIESNNASGTLGTGISVESLSFANAIVRNTASDNGGEGIEVADSAPIGRGNLVERNVASSNGGDGIIVDGTGHTITANVASLNGGWGIYAPVGALDGGSNFAAGNIEPGQCVGVRCTIGEVPGAPDTEILTGPEAVSHSRNASFTYIGSDATTQLVDLTYECRLDTTNDFAWEDCEYPHEIFNLSPGRHTLEVRTVEPSELADPTPARWNWTYEPLPANDPPEVFIDRAPERETWTLEALFTFHSNEPDVTFECRVDLFRYEPCGFDTAADMARGAFEWGLEEEEVGLHTFSVRAVDFEGNVGAPAIWRWRLFGVLTSFTDGPGFTPGVDGEPATGGEAASSRATISFEANVADATFECSLDLEPFTPCESPVTYTGLGLGDHELRVVATDENGVSEVEAAVYEWEVLEHENGPPETSIERAPGDGTSATTFEFEGVDDMTPPSRLLFQCRLDGVSELDWEECENPFNLLDLYTYEDFRMAPGPHVFEVRAVDDAEPLFPDPTLPNFEGNVDPTPAVHRWTSVADTTPPGTGILAGPPAEGAEAETAIEFFGVDDATPELQLAFACSLDGAPFEPCSSPEDLQVEPGAHELRIRAIDLAGNVDPTPATRRWTVLPPPTATITSGPSQPNDVRERAFFTFRADQDGATFECSLDGADFLPCTSPHAEWVVTDGEHTFEVRGVSRYRTVDGEPIVQEPATQYVWTAELGPDATRPDTTITAGPRPTTPDQIARFALGGSDNRTPPDRLEFECSLDGAPFGDCETPLELVDLVRGPHELQVRAIDLEGNVDASPARWEWTVTSPPVTTITSGPSDITEDPSPTFTFVADDPAAEFECWLDGPRGPCTSPVTYENLAGGEHVFAVRAKHPLGDYNQLWTDWEFEVGDVSPPVTTFHSGPQPSTEEQRAEFTFTANEPVAMFECSLDGADFAPCRSPLVFEHLHPGRHRLEVQGIPLLMLDALGQPIEPDFDPLPTAYEWTIIDRVPPETAIDWGPHSTTASLNAVFGLSSDDPAASFECSLDGESFETCEPLVEYTGLERGEHRLQVRARDFAGNVDASPAQHAWLITEPGPPNTPVGTNVTVTLPMPDGPGTATFEFAEVNQGGVTTVDALTGGLPLPAGYGGGGARYYDISTTAEYGEPMLVCLAYDPSRYATRTVRLLQSDGGTWIDVTTINDPFRGRLCAAEADIQSGEATSFAIAGANSSIAPLVSVISGPPPLSNSGTATFEFFVDVPDALVLCSIDGLPFTPCTSPVTFTHLEEGDQELQLQALSPFGIPSLLPTIYEWEVVLPPDRTPPDTVITRGPGRVTASFVNLLEFTGSDDQTAELELEFECALNGGPWESCDIPHEIEVETPGDHVVEVRALDETGNADPTPAQRRFRVVDLSAPDTTIDNGPNSETESLSATFEFSGEEENGTVVNEFECSLDGADFAPCSTPHDISGLSGGPHLFQVRAVDPDGNVDPTPDFYEWLVIAPVDTTPPDTMIFTAPPAISGPEVLFGFVATELVEEFECSLDGGAWEGCEAVHELTDLRSGDHELRVRALDMADPPNVDPTPAVHRWTVRGEPQTTIENGPSDPSTVPSATFEFSADQPGVTFECAVDDAPWVPCTSPFVAGPLAIEEEHTFEVRAVSPFTTLEGEPIVDESPARFEWMVLPAPEPPAFDTTITSAPPLVAAGGPEALTRFVFTANNPLASFECSLDGGPWEECEPPVEYEGLPDGDHEFRVRAVDPAEVPDDTPAIHRWTIEPAPETELLSASPEPLTDATTATFTFSSPAPDATFECSLDGAPYAACVSGVTFTDVPFGEHELLVRAKGPAGSVDQTPARHEWESGDMTPPVVTIRSGPPATTGSASATFELHVDDPAASLQCSLDGGPLTFCGSLHAYDDLAVGAHTLEVTAIKPHLLVEAEAAIWEWTVEDVTAPETTLVAIPPAAPTDPSATFELGGSDATTLVEDLTFECSLDGGAFAPCNTPHTVDGLEPGDHALEVRAVDEAGNVDATPASHRWTIAPPPPPNTLAGTNVTVVLPLSEPFSGSAAVTFASVTADGMTTVAPFEGGPALPEGYLPFGARYWELATTAAVGAPIAVCLPYEPLDERARLLRLDETTDAWVDVTLAADGAGRVCGTVDGLGAFAVANATAALVPDTTIVSAPLPTTVLVDASFAFASDDPAATFECALDGEALSSCEATHELTDLAVGDHELVVRAVNELGVADATPAVHRWTILPLPETFIDAAPDAATESTTASFQFSSDVPGATFECLLDDALFYVPCDARTTYTGLPLGDHELLVRAVDAAGHADPTPAEHAWEIGELPANVTIEFAPDAETESPSATFEMSADEPGTQFECSLDGSLFSSCRSPVTYDDLAPGEHTFAVRAHSVDPIVPPTVATHTWTVVDQTPPETAIDLAPPAVTAAANASFAFTSEQGATFECALDGAAFEPCESPAQYSDLDLGEHRFEVRAVDLAGNADPTPDSHEWTVGARPETTIDRGPESETESTTASFAFSSDVAGATFECALDGGGFAACSSPHELSDLANGDHVLAVRARSPLGLVDDTPAEYDWSVVQPPETTVSGPEATTSSTRASFTLSSNEGDVTFECALDGAAFAECLSPHVVEGLAHGPHELLVRAIDGDGNVDATPASHRWTIDLAAPQTTIDRGPSLVTRSTEATFAFSADEAGASFECSLDGATFAACRSPATYTGLSVGRHELRVRAIDALGNADGSPASFEWTIEAPDTTAPETTLGAGAPATGTTSTSASFTFFANETGATFECALDLLPFAACTAPKAYTGLAIGAHEFRVRAIDAAGNADASPAIHRWTIAAPAPSCRASTSTIGASSDSWILQDSANQNYGTDSVLKVDTKSNANARAVVRFTLPAIPAGCTLTSARLRLYASSYKTGRTLQALRIGAAWTERAVTWANQPATVGTAATVASGSGYREWLVTSHVQSQYGADGNNGFLIRDATENGSGLDQGFHSREKGTDNPPRLVLTFG
jgi:parallel beta-helix repeat protein